MLRPRDYIGKEYFVRFMVWDDQQEIEVLRTIVALDREDALVQGRYWVEAEGFWWYSVDIPLPHELREIGERLRRANRRDQGGKQT